MPSLRIRIKLNEGRLGIPLDKLAEIAKETEAFLELVAEDAGLDRSGWIATNFNNGSVIFDCQNAAPSADAYEQGKNTLRAVFSGKETTLVRPATRLQFSAIARKIDPDEVINFGVYANGEADPKEWYQLSHESAALIESAHPKSAKYYGEVQGLVHAFFKEAKKPYLVVRELSTRALIKCYFHPAMYEKAVETLSEPEGVVFVEGDLTEDLAKGVVESVEATDFRPAPLFDAAFIKSFIGSRPDLTGDLDSEEFLAKLHDDGGH